MISFYGLGRLVMTAVAPIYFVIKHFVFSHKHFINLSVCFMEQVVDDRLHIGSRQLGVDRDTFHLMLCHVVSILGEEG